MCNIFFIKSDELYEVDVTFYMLVSLYSVLLCCVIVLVPPTPPDPRPTPEALYRNVLNQLIRQITHVLYSSTVLVYSTRCGTTLC